MRQNPWVFPDIHPNTFRHGPLPCEQSEYPCPIPRMTPHLKGRGNEVSSHFPDPQEEAWATAESFFKVNSLEDSINFLLSPTV